MDSNPFSLQEIRPADVQCIVRMLGRRISAPTDDLMDAVNEAILYYLKRQERQERQETWESKRHLINAILWKAGHLWKDSHFQRLREVILDFMEDENGNILDSDEQIEHIAVNYALTDRSEARNTAEIYEEHELLCVFLDALTPMEREVYEYTMQGYTTEEIANLMGLSKQAVYKHLQRGRKRGRTAILGDSE